MNETIRFAKSGLQLHLNGSRGYEDVVNAIVEYMCDCFHAKADTYYSNSPDVYSVTFKWREFTVEMSVNEEGIAFKNLNPVIREEGSSKSIGALNLWFNGESFGTFRRHHPWWFRNSFTEYTYGIFDQLFHVLTEDTAILEAY